MHINVHISTKWLFPSIEVLQIMACKSDFGYIYNNIKSFFYTEIAKTHSTNKQKVLLCQIKQIVRLQIAKKININC